MIKLNPISCLSVASHTFQYELISVIYLSKNNSPNKSKNQSCNLNDQKYSGKAWGTYKVLWE